MCGFVGLAALLTLWNGADAQVGPVPTFDSAVIFSAGTSGSRPFGLAAADVITNPSGGYPEIAVACGAVNVFEEICDQQWSGTTPSVRIFRNMGTWTSDPSSALQVLQTITVSNRAPAEVSLTDLNGDGRADLVFTCASLNPCNDNTGAVVVILFREDFQQFGGYDPEDADVYSTGRPLRGLVVADLDGDGHSDVAAATDLRAGTGSGQIDKVFLWKNNGQGVLSAQPTVDLGQFEDFPWPVPLDLAAADFDRSGASAGKLDLAAANDAGDTFLLLRNTGSFAFTVVTPDDPDDCQANGYASVAAGRFGGGALNADDLVAIPYNSTKLSLFHGNNAGVFSHDCDCVNTPCDVYEVGQLAGDYGGVAAGHLNGGTKMDAAVALRDSGAVRLLLGKGDGTFETSRGSDTFLRSVGSVTAPVQVLVVDLDQDGFNDLVTANHGSANISVLRSRLVAITP